MSDPAYDLILRGGRVIDPANGIDAIRDVATKDGAIAAVSESLPADQARNAIDVSGHVVTPGLIDIHLHAFEGFRGWLIPDEHCLVNGTTTVVDTGSAGWRTFDAFRTGVMAYSKTRVLAFLNIVGWGMQGGQIENDIEDMEPGPTAECVAANPDQLIGVKTAHFNKPGWAAVDRCVEAGRLCGKPAMIDFWPQEERPYHEMLLQHLRPGDIHTHVYAKHFPILNERGKVESFMREAREKGVLFDVGHGAGSFWWRQAVPALADGFPPDSISTDMHKGSILVPQATMPFTMSKLMAIGIDLPELIRLSTVTPAAEIGRPDLGTLSVGAEADVAVLQVEEGDFGFVDSGRARMNGAQRLRCAMTLRAGQVVWDLNGLAFTDWREAGEYGVLDQYGEERQRRRRSP